MAQLLKRGDRVLCTHYKNKPVCFVDSIVNGEVWVYSCKSPNAEPINWWGPRNWFRKLQRAITCTTCKSNLVCQGFNRCPQLRCAHITRPHLLHRK